MSPFISQLERKENGYIVSLTSISKIIKSRKVVGLFTRWYRRDKYLQVAADGLDPHCLILYLKWGGTLEGSCSVSDEARVSLRHTDYPAKTDHRIVPVAWAEERAAVLGFQEKFFMPIDVLRKHGYFNGDSLTLVVTFNT